jgi:hypothetical protein
MDLDREEDMKDREEDMKDLEEDMKDQEEDMKDREEALVNIIRDHHLKVMVVIEAIIREVEITIEEEITREAEITREVDLDSLIEAVMVSLEVIKTNMAINPKVDFPGKAQGKASHINREVTIKECHNSNQDRATGMIDMMEILGLILWDTILYRDHSPKDMMEDKDNSKEWTHGNHNRIKELIVHRRVR